MSKKAKMSKYILTFLPFLPFLIHEIKRQTRIKKVLIREYLLREVLIHVLNTKREILVLFRLISIFFLNFTI